MENMEEIERQFFEALEVEFKKSGGNNGIDHNIIDPILKMPLEQRNEYISKLIKEKKIVKINHLNGTSYTLPK